MDRLLHRSWWGGEGSRSPLARVLIALIVTSIVAAPFLLPSASAQITGLCPPAVTQKGNWFTIKGPKFKAGGSDITVHGVDRANQYLLYASNGTEVRRSGNGGCSWDPAFSGGGALPVDLTGGYTIEQIYSPRPAGVMLRVQDGPTPRVFYSVSNGQPDSWQEGGTGLPPVGDIEFLTSSQVQNYTIYAGIDSGSGAVDLLYVSTDGGQTFTLRSDLSEAIPNGGIQGVTVDPFDPNLMWAYGSGGLYRSQNAGASFKSVDAFVGKTVTAVTVHHEDGFRARIFAFTPGGGFLSEDGGRNFFQVGSPADTTYATQADGAAEVAVAAQGQIWGFDDRYERFNSLGCPTAGCTQVESTIGIPTNYVAHTARTIERYEVATSGTDFIYGIDVPPLQESADAVLGSASLGPDGEKIRIPLGRSKEIDYKLTLPRTPVPLDVYFLMDTSNSMTRPLAGLARSVAAIAQGLENKGINVEFGLAEFRSYPDNVVPRSPEPNFIYKQRADVGVELPALEQIIESLRPEAGGFYDAHLAALYQTATGAGQDVYPEGVSNEGDVPRGRQANFRSISDGLRVVIHGSDEAFGGEGQDRDGFVNSPSTSGKAPPPDIPTHEEVIAALNDRNIKHIGIAIGTIQELVADMRDISRGTGTIASKPTDCNGDGSADIAPGDPLVCRVPADSSDDAALMVPVVVDLLEQVQPKATVDIEVTGDDRVVSGISQDTFSDIVLQSAKELEFTVTYRCGASMAGERFDVKIAPSVDLVTDVPSAQTTVVCGDEDELIEPPVPTEVLPLIAIPLIPAAPPPPAPITNAQPVTQSQAQAQGAAAQQEQEEPQLAYVAAEEGLAEEELYAMSSYERRQTMSAEALFGAGVVAVSLMYGLGLSLRNRVQRRNNFN